MERILVALMAVVIVGCGGSGGSEPPGPTWPTGMAALVGDWQKGDYCRLQTNGRWQCPAVVTVECGGVIEFALLNIMTETTGFVDSSVITDLNYSSDGTINTSSGITFKMILAQTDYNTAYVEYRPGCVRRFTRK